MARMTRFQQEISGALGEYWKKSAEEEVKEKIVYANENATVEEDGAIRWANGGNYLMDDYCEILEYAGYPFSREATRIKREEQNAISIAEYKERMKNYVPTEEELYEMRAAFGDDVSVVDIISGSTIHL